MGGPGGLGGLGAPKANGFGVGLGGFGGQRAPGNTLHAPTAPTLSVNNFGAATFAGSFGRKGRGPGARIPVAPGTLLWQRLLVVSWNRWQTS